MRRIWGKWEARFEIGKQKERDIHRTVPLIGWVCVLCPDFGRRGDNEAFHVLSMLADWSFRLNRLTKEKMRDISGFIALHVV